MSDDIKIIIKQRGTIPVYTTTKVGSGATWGQIDGNVLDQKDLVNYIKSQTGTFVFDMGILDTEWTITHNLNKWPTVVLVDSAGSVAVPDVKYIDSNTCFIQTKQPFKGKAYLN